MSKPRALASTGLGALGILVWGILVALVWQHVPPVADGVAETALSIRASVSDVHGRLGSIDDALGTADAELATFRGEHGIDDAALGEMKEALAPVVGTLREDIEAVREIVLGIDRLLETLDLPFLDTARRAGADRAAEIRERVDALREQLPHPGEEPTDPVVDLQPARELVAGVRGRVGAWRGTLAELAADLEALRTRAPRLATWLCGLVTLLALWSIAGMGCLVRAGTRALRS